MGSHFKESVPGREEKGSQGWGVLGGSSQVQRVRGTGESVQTLEAALMPGLGGADREEALCQGPY